MFGVPSPIVWDEPQPGSHFVGSTRIFARLKNVKNMSNPHEISQLVVSWVIGVPPVIIHL